MVVLLTETVLRRVVTGGNRKRRSVGIIGL